MTKHDSESAQASSLSAEIDEALAWCSYSNGHKTARLLVRLRDLIAESSARANHAEAALREAQTYCARPAGVCMPKEPLA